MVDLCKRPVCISEGAGGVRCVDVNPCRLDEGLGKVGLDAQELKPTRHRIKILAESATTSTATA
jgi:hypothetical protein